MSNTITGNEPIGVIHDTGANATGMTLRQKALLEFMCELIHHKEVMEDHNPDACAELAEKYVTAYINQLNKEI